MPSALWIELRTLAVVGLIGLAACGTSDGGVLVPGFGNSTAVEVLVSPSPASVAVGLTLQMRATLIDDEGREVAGSVAWSSSDRDVASVSGLGVVTGRAGGSVTITASAGSVSGDATVTVVASN